MISAPKAMVQIKSIFTEIFLIMHSAKIVYIVLLR